AVLAFAAVGIAYAAGGAPPPPLQPGQGRARTVRLARPTPPVPGPLAGAPPPPPPVFRPGGGPSGREPAGEPPPLARRRPPPRPPRPRRHRREEGPLPQDHAGRDASGRRGVDLAVRLPGPPVHLPRRRPALQGRPGRPPVPGQPGDPQTLLPGRRRAGPRPPR